MNTLKKHHRTIIIAGCFSFATMLSSAMSQDWITFTLAALATLAPVTYGVYCAWTWAKQRVKRKLAKELFAEAGFQDENSVPIYIPSLHNQQEIE